MQKTIKRTHLSFKRACPRSGSEGVAKVERLVSDHRPVECLRWVLEQLCGSVVTAARTGRHWRAALSRFPAACEAFASSRPRAFSDTRPARTCTLHSPALLERLRFSARSSTVRSACRAFELFATAALPYKYGARWRGSAAATLAHDASRTIPHRHKLEMQPVSSPLILLPAYQLHTPISTILAAQYVRYASHATYECSSGSMTSYVNTGSML